jgi:hypothetical protein
MVKNPFHRDGRLSDGFPVRDLVQGMPLEARDGGSITFDPGVFVRFDDDMLLIELDRGPTRRFPKNFVRRPR